MDDTTEPTPVGTCAECADPIDAGTAYIENADGALFHPEHYPEPVEDADDPDTLDIPTEPAPKAKK